MARPLVKPAFASSIHYAPPVQDISELANVGAASRADKQQRLVEDEGSIYHFDFQSTAGDIDGPPPITVDTDGVVEPNDAPTTGRWLKIQGSIQDHGVLLGLGDDDHPQYFLLPGRFGGQTATGGTAIADVLGLRGSVSASGAVRVLDEFQVGAGAKITTAGAAIFNDSVLIGTSSPSGSEILTVAGDALIAGRLGINENSPVSALHVTDTAAPSGGQIALITGIANASQFTGQLSIASPDTTRASIRFIVNAADRVRLDALQSGATGGIFVLSTRNGGSYSEALRVTESQIVLIGTATPSGSELFHVSGGAYIDGKLTVTGAIDPVSLALSGSTALFIESNDGSTATVSASGTGRIRYLAASGWQASVEGGVYENLVTTSSDTSNSLDGAYNLGRTITVDAGAVQLTGTSHTKILATDEGGVDLAALFSDGDMVLGSGVMSGSERLRVTGGKILAEGGLDVTGDNLTVTTRALIADGLGSTPSLAFSNDLNTGIFRPGPDSLGIAASGNQVANFTSILIDFEKLVQVSFGMEVGGGQRIRSVNVGEIGIQVTNDPLTVGTLGSLVTPVKPSGSAPSDAEGGNLDGALVLNNSEDRLYVRTSAAWLMVHTGDTIIPSASGVGTIGTTSNRWGNLFADSVTTGDLHMRSSKGDWTMKEQNDHVQLVNNITGEKYKLVLEGID